MSKGIHICTQEDLIKDIAKDMVVLKTSKEIANHDITMIRDDIAEIKKDIKTALRFNEGVIRTLEETKADKTTMDNYYRQLKEVVKDQGIGLAELDKKVQQKEGKVLYYVIGILITIIGALLTNQFVMLN